MADLYVDSYGEPASAGFAVTVNAAPVAPPTGSASANFAITVLPVVVAPSGNDIYTDPYGSAVTASASFSVTINPATTQTGTDNNRTWTGSIWKADSPTLVWTGTQWR